MGNLNSSKSCHNLHEPERKLKTSENINDQIQPLDQEIDQRLTHFRMKSWSGIFFYNFDGSKKIM